MTAKKSEPAIQDQPFFECFEIIQIVKGLQEVLIAYAWPAVSIILLILFRKELSSLIHRIRKAGINGIEADAAEQRREINSQTSTPSISAQSDVENNQLRDIPGRSRTPTIANLEREILANLQSIESNSKIPILVNALSQARLEAAFERIYRVIFGSQLIGLRRLNEQSRVSIEEAKEFYEDYKSRFPEFYSQYSFENWLGFLKSQGLIQEENGSLTISELGRDFLLYMLAWRLSENKPW